jgi:hypothetical protein
VELGIIHFVERPERRKLGVVTHPSNRQDDTRTAPHAANWELTPPPVDISRSNIDDGGPTAEAADAPTNSSSVVERDKPPKKKKTSGV